jgi:hypothetical protein
MADKRELILARIETCLGLVKFVGITTLPGNVNPMAEKKVYRNRGEIAANGRPAITMLDGDEEGGVAAIQSSRGSVTAPPSVVFLRPEIYGLLDNREPKNPEVGQDLNKLRKEMLRVIFTDGPLATLIGDGAIIYEGCQTDLASGRSMEGQVQLRIAIRYSLKSADMTEENA